MDILKSVGFTGNGLRIAYAVAMAESSGNARAYNGNANTGDKSYGLFQINMLGDMGPERLRQYRLSSNEQLYDPYVNARVAFEMSKGGTRWGDWSTYNRGDYKEFLGGADIQVKNSGSSGAAPPSGPSLNADELAERYGWASSFLNSIPELKKLFGDAVGNGWTREMFTAKLRDTNWFKSMSADERKWAAEWETDPATAHAKLSAAKIKARQYAAKLGMVENAELDKRIEEAAMGLVSKGWDESQMRYFLGQYVYFGGDQREGEGGEVFDELRKYAYNMGVELNGEWYAERARNIVRGIATVQDNKNEILKLARAQFPQWIPQLDGGQSVADIAQPYLQTMATILELPAGSVNLFDNTIKTALNYTNPSTLEKSAKPLWQFENELRNDPRWKQTKNAQDSMFQVGHKILADFGLKY